MRDEPKDLTKDHLVEALNGHWGIDVQGLEYAAVGAGSYHWVATMEDGRRWFITADNLVSMATQVGSDREANFSGLRAAFETAAELREGGLTFMVAPLADRAGQVLIRVLPDWSMAVFPFVAAERAGPGPWSNSGLREVAAGMIGRLHSASPPHTISRWDAAIPFRAELMETLRDLDGPWSSGPYAERVRELLKAAVPALQGRIGDYDRLAASLAGTEESWVVTHGEPHSGNFLTADGRMYLIDWDTVRLAPRERDLWDVVGGDANALAAYQAVAGQYQPSPGAMELFDKRWMLADICVYLERLRQPHDGSADDQRAWEALVHYVGNLGGS